MSTSLYIAVSSANMSGPNSKELCCCCCVSPMPEKPVAVTMDVYQPVVPSGKGFHYPQDQTEQHGHASDVFPDDVIDTQPSSGSVLPSTEQRPTSLVTRLVSSAPQRQPQGMTRPRPKVEAGAPTTPSVLTPGSTPSTEPTPTAPTPTPTGLAFAPYHAAMLEFNLYFDTHRKSLCVQIHRGLYFPLKKGMKTVNSYIKAFLRPSQKQVLKTRHINNSQSPAFDNLLEFSSLSLEELKEETLVLKVYYCDRDGNDKYLSSCFTKLRDMNLLESNQLAKRIDEGKALLQHESLSIDEEIKEIFSSSCDRNGKPGLTFSVYYNSWLHKLSIHFKDIFHLPTNLPEEKSNPYVHIYLLGKESRDHLMYTSRCILQSHHPVFDCVATFSNISAEELVEQELVFRVYVNEERHFLGGVVYPLHMANSYGSTVRTEILTFPEEDALKEDMQADLLLSMCYKPTKKIIVVTIVEVKIRKSETLHDSTNPYIKVNLFYNGERIAKWKTTVKKGTLNPVYRQSCALDLSLVGDETTELHVVLMSTDHLHHSHHFGRKTKIGRVKFGDYVRDHQTGLEQWRKAFQSPDTTITAWHPVFSSPHAPHRRLFPSRQSSGRSTSPQGQGSRLRSRSKSPVFKHLKLSSGT